jgi:hypothetical protein
MRLDDGQIEVVEDVMAEVLRRKTPAERIRIGFNLWMSARKMLLFHLGKTRPDWDKKKVEEEVARRFLHGSL